MKTTIITMNNKSKFTITGNYEEKLHWGGLRITQNGELIFSKLFSDIKSIKTKGAE